MSDSQLSRPLATRVLPVEPQPAPVVDAAAEMEASSQAVSPYLHIGPDRLYNPLIDRELTSEEPEYRLLRGLLTGELAPDDLDPDAELALRRDQWLQSEDQDLSRSYYLKYVSLEAHTVCNQACYFCPVSFAPREDHFMPTELYARIIEQLAPYRDTIEGVSMINYNEPTLDPRFLDQVRMIKQAGLPPAVLTNGTGLSRKRVDGLLEMGGVHYLSINLSTLDREKYRQDREGDHLEGVLRKMDYMADKALAPTMEIVVLGTGDPRHQADHVEIQERFAGSRFEVKFYEVMDRAGLLQIGMRPPQLHARLCGCQNLGSRPLQHLHITPHGKCILCCEDYDERYVVGDLNEESIDEVLTGPRLALLRRWIYGVEEAPEDFICRKCIYARTR